MAVSREYSVMELDGARLVAVSASVSGTRIEVKRCLVASRPESVAPDDAEAVGKWIAAEFRQAKLPTTKVVLSVSRGDIILKQLSVPAPSGGATVNEADLAGIVRLAMVRQLTMPLEGTAIDYLPEWGLQESPDPNAQSARVVLAGAMPAARVAWCREVTSRAGMKLRRIGLRSFGAAALLAETSQRRGGPVLGVAIGSGSTEFVVIDEGVMTFARAVDNARPGARSEIDAFAERTAVEAKRTWMSYRAMRASREAELVAVIGAGELSQAVGERCASAINCGWDVVEMPPFVVLPATINESDRALAAPLVGMLIESMLGRPTLDFANPRRLPDRAARNRQFVLAGLLGMIVLGGAGYVVADQKLGRLRTELSEAQTHEQGLRRELDQYLVRHAKVNHFEQWTAARVDWLTYLNQLATQLPDASVGQVDQIGGRVSAATVYAPAASGGYPGGQWTSRPTVTFDLAGKVGSRQVASEFRERLLSTGIYEVASQGPDVPDRFSVQLTATRVSPGNEPETSGSAPRKPAPKPDSKANAASSPKGGG